jgi:hypothetical protein
MTRFTQEQGAEPVRTASRPPEPEPAPLAPGSMEWASALGNQAVARLARQAAPESESEFEGEEVEGAEAGPEAAVAATIDALPEDELPD